MNPGQRGLMVFLVMASSLVGTIALIGLLSFTD